MTITNPTTIEYFLSLQANEELSNEEEDQQLLEEFDDEDLENIENDYIIDNGDGQEE